MTDTPIEILRYEAWWTSEKGWEECSQTDFEAIHLSIHPHPYKARVIGVVQDPAGLLLPGPKGQGSWRDAAISEKLKRVELEREMKTLKARIGQLENITLFEPSVSAQKEYVAQHFVQKHFCVACGDYTVAKGVCERNANHVWG